MPARASLVECMRSYERLLTLASDPAAKIDEPQGIGVWLRRELAFYDRSAWFAVARERDGRTYVDECKFDEEAAAKVETNIRHLIELTHKEAGSQQLNLLSQVPADKPVQEVTVQPTVEKSVFNKEQVSWLEQQPQEYLEFLGAMPVEEQIEQVNLDMTIATTTSETTTEPAPSAESTPVAPTTPASTATGASESIPADEFWLVYESEGGPVWGLGRSAEGEQARRSALEEAARGFKDLHKRAPEQHELTAVRCSEALYDQVCAFSGDPSYWHGECWLIDAGIAMLGTRTTGEHQTTSGEQDAGAGEQQAPTGEQTAESGEQKQLPAPVDAGGYQIDPETGEILTPEEAFEVLGIVQKSTEFGIHSQEEAEWFVGKMYQLLSGIEATFKQLEVITAGNLRAYKSLMDYYGPQLRQFVEPQLPRITKGARAGEFRAKNWKCLHGTVFFKSTGGWYVRDKEAVKQRMQEIHREAVIKALVQFVEDFRDSKNLTKDIADEFKGDLNDLIDPAITEKYGFKASITWSKRKLYSLAADGHCVEGIEHAPEHPLGQMGIGGSGERSAWNFNRVAKSLRESIKVLQNRLKGLAYGADDDEDDE